MARKSELAKLSGRRKSFIVRLTGETSVSAACRVAASEIGIQRTSIEFAVGGLSDLSPGTIENLRSAFPHRKNGYTVLSAQAVGMAVLRARQQRRARNLAARQ